MRMICPIGPRSGSEPASRRRVPHLVVPYALDINDMRFATAQGFNRVASSLNT